jgi:hypothetical protein
LPPKIVILRLLLSRRGTLIIVRESIKRCAKTTPIEASLIGVPRRRHKGNERNCNRI